MKKILVFLVVLSLFALGVSALDVSDTYVGSATTVTGSASFTESSAQTATATGGNITRLNLASQASTQSWAGFYGNVSASLSLGLNTDKLYSFGMIGDETRITVMASTGDDFDWSGMVAGTIADADTALGWTASDIDSVTNTFNDTESVLSTSVPGARLVTCNSSGSAINMTGDVFITGLFDDGGSALNDHVWTVPVLDDKKDFMNDAFVEYEMIVPVNGSGSGRTLTYNFYFDIQ